MLTDTGAESTDSNPGLKSPSGKLKRIPINDSIPHQVRAISAQENCWQKAVNLSWKPDNGSVKINRSLLFLKDLDFDGGSVEGFYAC